MRKRLDRVLIEVWQLEFLEPLELSASVLAGKLNDNNHGWQELALSQVSNRMWTK